MIRFLRVVRLLSQLLTNGMYASLVLEVGRQAGTHARRQAGNRAASTDLASAAADVGPASGYRLCIQAW